MKRASAFAILILFFILLTGMGSSGKYNSVKVPKTDKNFTVNLVDITGVSVCLENFSIEGKTNVFGTFGKSDISIDFDQITSIAFVLKEKVVKATVKLYNGVTMDILINKRKKCFGTFSFTNFRIYISNIKSLEFIK